MKIGKFEFYRHDESNVWDGVGLVWMIIYKDHFYYHKSIIRTIRGFIRTFYEKETDW